METYFRVEDSNRTGYTYPATWVSKGLAVKALGGDGFTIRITWRDVSLTFYLHGGDGSGGVSDRYDWTADYRAFDPAWVDPVIGDARTSHYIRVKNLGFPFVYIGWSASNWLGANRYLAISLSRDRYVK
jgi:hypothetical protein